MFSHAEDLSFMRMAVDLAKKSRSEDDGRIHPFVGAVIVNRTGNVIATGYRGQHTLGNHGEQEALIDIPDDLLKGAIVYSTLEPCTFRGKQMPCCHRLLDKQVSEVVIGILDPNRDIRGQGWWKFEERCVRVRNFDSQFIPEIRAMNNDFIDYQLGPGLMITQIVPEGRDTIGVSDANRAGREILEVSTQRLVVRGTFRVKPTTGDRIATFVRRQDTYWPQQRINFDADREARQWEAVVYAKLGAEPLENEIVIARISEDLEVVIRHYNTVADELSRQPAVAAHDKWIGIRMLDEPPGFKRLTELTVRGKRAP